MKYRRAIYAIIVGLILIFSIGLSQINMKKNVNTNIQYSHLIEMEEGANPLLGETELADDYEVKSDFVSHMPLVIIDTEGEEIPNVYTYNSQEKRIVLREEGLNPYIKGKISVIDNDNNVNRLSDEAKVISNMEIKHRGNSSINFKKHQYKVKLFNENGEANKVSMLGMEEEQDWILNISMIDSTLVRNYMVYTLGAQMFEFAPEAKYCEVIKKNGDKYTYEGVYLMMESIKQGKGRVDIEDYNPKNNYTSYLLRRDRYDDEELMIEDTYALDNNLGYGYLGVKYPSGDLMDQKAYNYIHKDIDTIERIIYSNDRETFMKYKDYIDEESFMDYFIINEVFANYDAGNNSTYMYKNDGQKLKMGPIWDYDNAMDNMGSHILNPKCISFKYQPWFKELVQSEEFCKKLEKRYKELSETILNPKYIEKFIDDTIEYMGNARERDWNRWKEQYTEARFHLLEDENGIVIDRNYETSEEFVQRLKDVINEHSLYIGIELQKVTDDSIYKIRDTRYVGFAIIFIVAFFSSVVVIRRYN